MSGTCGRCGADVAFDHASCGSCGSPWSDASGERQTVLAAPPVQPVPQQPYYPAHPAYPAQAVKTTAFGRRASPPAALRAPLGRASYLVAALLGIGAIGGSVAVQTSEPAALFDLDYLSTLLWTFPYLLAILAVVASRVPLAGSLTAVGSVLAYLIVNDQFSRIPDGAWQFLVFVPALVAVELVVLVMLRRDRIAGALIGGLLGGLGIVLADNAAYAITEGYFTSLISEWRYTGPSVLFPIMLALGSAGVGWLLGLVVAPERSRRPRRAARAGPDSPVR